MLERVVGSDFFSKYLQNVLDLLILLLLTGQVFEAMRQRILDAFQIQQ